MQHDAHGIKKLSDCTDQASPRILSRFPSVLETRLPEEGTSCFPSVSLFLLAEATGGTRSLSSFSLPQTSSLVASTPAPELEPPSFRSPLPSTFAAPLPASRFHVDFSRKAERMPGQRPDSPSRMALLADHSHQSTPMLNGQEAATAGDHEAVELEYSEKDLDDALSYLDSQRRASASSRVPGWAKRLADSTRVVSRKTGAVSRRSLLGCCLALMVFLTIVTTSLGEADTDSFNLVSEPTLKQESRPAGVLDAVVKAPARVAGAVKELGWSAWDKAVGASVEKPKVWKGLNPLHVSLEILAEPTSRLGADDCLRDRC